MPARETRSPEERLPEDTAPRAGTGGLPRISPDKGDEQLAEYVASVTPQLPEAKEPPKSAAPGSSPFKTISDDAAAAQAFTVDPKSAAPGERWVWDRTAYGSPVKHYY